VIFALSLINRETFKLVREFQPQYSALMASKKVEVSIYYDLFVCESCARMEFAEEHPDCLGGGRYCALDPDGPNVGTGRDVVEESLRQLCIF
jgi:hypothetical protein